MTRRILDVLREAWAVALTPVKVRQDASTDGHNGLRTDRGWAYRSPVFKADAVLAAAAELSPKDVDVESRRLRDLAAAIARGRGNPTPLQELPPRELPATAKAEGGR